MRKLTEKQKRFCDEYLIDLNATQAAIRAGYKTSSAGDIGSENLKKPDIRAYIDKAMAERSKRTGINQDRVLIELAKIGLANAADIINFDEASVLDYANRDDLAVVQSVKVKTMSGEKGDSVEREVKLYDKTRALELIGKHLGMFKDKVEVEGTQTVIFEGENELED